MQRAEESEQLRITAGPRIVSGYAHRHEPLRQPAALAGAVAALLRKRQLHLQVIAIGDPESGHLRRFDSGLDREAQRISDLDPVGGQGRRKGVDDALDRGLVLGVQLGDEGFRCDHFRVPGFTVSKK